MPSLLSINVNRIALLRNSRPGHLPSLTAAASACVAGGADGITIHPRPDERHITRADVGVLAHWLRNHNENASRHIEFNIEGYPDERFMELVRESAPEQCTLVPDGPDQATSDHGWDVESHRALLETSIRTLKDGGARVSLFVDATEAAVEAAASVGADRIELYTEPYAIAWGTEAADRVLDDYTRCAVTAGKLGLGINAGHDLNLDNLPAFSTLPGLAECSIGHAVACDAMFVGLEASVALYARAIQGEHVDHPWYPERSR